jgi:hypothetical protein
MLLSGWVFTLVVSNPVKELFPRFESVKTGLEVGIYLLLFPKAGVGYNL